MSCFATTWIILQLQNCKLGILYNCSPRGVGAAMSHCGPGLVHFATRWSLYNQFLIKSIDFVIKISLSPIMSFGYSLVTLGHFATTWVTFQLNLAGCTTGASATWDTSQLDGHFTTVWVALQLFGPLCNLVFFRIFRLGSLYNQFGSLHNHLEPLCF